MARKSTNKKAAKLQQQIDELDLKKRNGLMRCIAAIVGFTVLIILKISLVNGGAEWANTMVANAVFFMLALVAAGIAGWGSRDWKRAKVASEALRQKLKG